MRRFKKYLITLLVGIALVALILASKGVFSMTNPAEILHGLTDAFFVVGVVMTGGGLLVFSSNEGSFDMLVYGVSSFLDFFRKTSRKKYDTFYDYRESRADKKYSFGFLLICGLFFVAVSLVLLYFYGKYA